MDKAKKKRIKQIVSLVCIVALVAFLAAMPLLARQKPDSDGPQASILSGTVQTGSIDIALTGGGTLAEEDAVSITVPSAVKLTAYLAANGDAVREGDPIASVDRVTVMTAIAQVQQTLEHLDEEIESAREEDTDGTVLALAGGTVKLLYAREGASVQDVMLEHGALAVLSLDGLMAVDLTAQTDLRTGDPVTVTLSDGTAVSGTVDSNLAGELTVTLMDDAYPVGEAVQVSAEDGTAIGSGELYIYSPWNATAYAGTIDRIQVSEGETVDAGDPLMELVDTGDTPAYRQLVGQRREYEELMLELFQMYQSEQITAPCDGVVSGVDPDSAQLLAASGSGWTLTLLSNAPNGDDEALYTNYIGQVTAIEESGWSLLIDPMPLTVTDYKDLSGISADPSAMTQAVSYASDAPIYALADGIWTQLDAAEVRPGDILLFACDESGSFVWVVRVTEAEDQVPDISEPPTEPTEPDTPEAPTMPEDTTMPTAPEDAVTPTEPGISRDPVMPSGSYSSGGGSWNTGGSFSQGSGAVQTPEFELYALDVTQIAAVTPQSTMTMEVPIDEQDITALRPGMTAEIRIDALGGEKYTAVITDIGNTGVNNGGSSKFTVELTWDRGADMLAGMNATATILLETADDVLTIPAAALVEDGTRTLVYTGFDEEQELLTDPVAVTTGVSDGETVQILEGLSAGMTYYYAYYDTLEISFTSDFGGRSIFGR